MKRALLALCAAALAFCGGCLGALPVDEYGYIQSIGVDKGESKPYAYSFLMQDEAAAGAEGSGEGAGSVVLCAEGATVFEAIAAMVSGLPYNLNFTRVSTVFFSEEVARAGGVTDFIAISQEAMRMRNSTKFVVVQGSAGEYQGQLQAVNSPNLTKTLRGMMQDYKMEGILPVINYALFVEAVETGRFDPVLSLGAIDESIEPRKKEGAEKTDPDDTTGGTVRKGGMRAYAMGAALFDGVRMVGVLSGEETKYLLMARGELGQTYITYVAEDGTRLSVGLSLRKKPRVRLWAEETPRAEVEIHLNCEIDMDTSGSAKTRWEALEPGLRAYVQRALGRVFESCRSLNCDAMGFGKAAARTLREQGAWERYAWKEKYPALQAQFTVNMRLADRNIEGATE